MKPAEVKRDALIAAAFDVAAGKMRLLVKAHDPAEPVLVAYSAACSKLATAATEYADAVGPSWNSRKAARMVREALGAEYGPVDWDFDHAIAMVQAMTKGGEEVVRTLATVRDDRDALGAELASVKKQRNVDIQRNVDALVRRDELHAKAEREVSDLRVELAKARSEQSALAAIKQWRDAHAEKLAEVTDLKRQLAGSHKVVADLRADQKRADATIERQQKMLDSAHSRALDIVEITEGPK